MNITLYQLKEIAKAGYGDSKYMDMIYPIFSVTTDHKNFVQFHADFMGLGIDQSRFSFNALAAIRKMEELGLIEK